MKLFIVFLIFILNSCSTMNSKFSCDVTAGDSCLTIEQVDEMTRFADGNLSCKKVLLKKELRA